MKYPVLIFLILFPFLTFSQKDTLQTGNSDSTLTYEQIVQKHNPGKAALYSLFPGGGQIYNKRYWKLPIIYGGLIAVGFWFARNNKEFKNYKAEAINRFNNGTIINYPELSDNQILEEKNYWERQRNISIFVFIGVYLLNIADATVDAYFYEFDISEDITLRAEPFIHPSGIYSTAPPTYGISLTLKL